MSQVKANSYYDTSGGSNAVLYGVAAPANSMGFRNRLINGDCRIDQRNAGASVTPTSAGYTLDRWKSEITQSSKFSVQRSTTTATGFTNSLLVTSLSAYSISSTDEFLQRQNIEGFNTADLAWGTASAQAVTLSFLVRSSLTGTFGGSLQNSGANRCYPFTFTISAANTFEYKTVTIAGDTTGTWVTDNGIGIRVNFGLGVGSTYSGTAGAWSSTYYSSATGATSVVGTNGATFYITGVQLEAGSVASPFERVEYGAMLRACQRYAIKYLGNGAYEKLSLCGWASSSTTFTGAFALPVPMRSSPTVTFSSLACATTGGSSAVSAVNVDQTSTLSPSFNFVTTGLTTGYASVVQANNSTSAFVLLSSEL
jgi:hypothetical protein